MENFDKITYNGTEYIVRIVELPKSKNLIRVGSLELEYSLLNDECDAFKDAQAESIDNNIAYYVGEGAFKEYEYRLENVPDQVLIDYIIENIDDDLANNL